MMLSISTPILLKAGEHHLLYLWFNMFYWATVESADIESDHFRFQSMFRAVFYSLRRIPLYQIHVYDYLCTLCIVTYILDAIL